MSIFELGSCPGFNWTLVTPLVTHQPILQVTRPYTPHSIYDQTLAHFLIRPIPNFLSPYED